MDDLAENGFAAHWKYKEDSSGSNSLDSWLVRIREFLEDPENDDEDFIESFQMNLFASEIFVFTPKGEMLTLPKGATALISLIFTRGWCTLFRYQSKWETSPNEYFEVR